MTPLQNAAEIPRLAQTTVDPVSGDYPFPVRSGGATTYPNSYWIRFVDVESTATGQGKFDQTVKPLTSAGSVVAQTPPTPAVWIPEHSIVEAWQDADGWVIRYTGR